MNEVIEKNINIEDMIYEIRGKQVMLDSNLAKLYQCTNGTKDINKAVKRNLDRFPNDFYFQLTNEEYNDILRFQNGTLELQQGKYTKYLPHVFTEEGVSMLASVLHTEIASEISVRIMRAFVAMRKYISNNFIELKNINNMLIRHENKFEYIDNEIKNLNNSFNKLEEDEMKKVLLDKIKNNII